MKKLFIVLNSEKFLLSHRLEIAKKAKENGLDVYVLAPNTGYAEDIVKEGFKFIEVPFSRSGLNVVQELKTMLKLSKLYRKHKPDIIHHVTIKVCLLGCLSAKMANRKNVVNAISGFGYVFSDRASSSLRRFVSMLIKTILKGKNYNFIVQNPDDYAQLMSFGITTEEKVKLIRGSGVNLDNYDFTPIPEEDFYYLFPSRMLYEKGVLEFIESARILEDKLKGKARFVLVGNCDEGNKSVISEEELRKLTNPPYIEYLGFRTDMVNLLKKSSVAVLPSYYREGLPKALIEACAIGRPIITTNLPGCKETLRNDNGLYVKEKDAKDLAEKELQMFENREKLSEYGKKSRELAERDFDVNKVVQNHMEIYSKYL